MIKTTFLTGEYPPMQGGIADHTAYLSKHLAALHVESSILISHRWKDATTSQIDKPSLSIQNPKSKIQSPEVFSTVPNWGWRSWPAVAKFLATHRPDILHIQYQAAAFDLGGWINWLPWYLKKRGVTTRLVTTFHDLRNPYIFPKAGDFRQKSVLGLARYSDAVICTNREDLRSLSESFNATRAGHQPKIQLIPLGSNVEAQPPPGFDRNGWRAKYCIEESTLLLAYFGFLNESKGGDILIESLDRLRRQGIDAQLLLIGGDVGDADPTNIAHAQRIQALIDRKMLTDVVHRTGYVELSEVSANLLAADVIVMPYRDGVSFRRTTLIAALRHGCPVISTTPFDPALIPEIEAGHNMLLVPPDDAAALATAIAPLVDDVAVRAKLSRGAKQLGSLFEWGKIAADTAALYQSLMSKS